MISLWKLREKKNVAQMPFVKNTPVQSYALMGIKMVNFRVFGMSEIMSF